MATDLHNLEMHPAQLVWKKADHPSDSLNTKTETWGLLSLDRFILFVGMPSVHGIPRLVHSVACGTGVDGT